MASSNFYLPAILQPPRERSRSTLRPGLDQFDEMREPGVGLVTVDHAVVDRQRHIGHRQDHDRVLPVDLARDDALLQFADAEDRGLALVKDDRRGEERTGYSMIGDGEASPRDVGAVKLSIAGAAREIVELGADLFEAE